jgi:predicted aspartyl protease
MICKLLATLSAIQWITAATVSTAGTFSLDFTYKNGSFLTQLELGSDHTPINLIFDTGSSDFWVPSNVFNGTDSSETFHWNDTDTFQMAYGTGDVRPTGRWGYDNMYFQNKPLGSYSFAVADNTQYDYGIIGLGFPSLESTNSIHEANSSGYQYNQFTEILVEQGIVGNRLFSIDLSRTRGDGTIIFGGIDKSRISQNANMYQYPMVNAFFTRDGNRHSSIAITLNSMSVISTHDIVDVDNTEEANIVKGYFPALLDTGTTYAMFPSAVFNQLVQKLNLQHNPTIGLFTTSCASLQDQALQLSFQGVNYKFPVSSLFVKSQNGEECAFMVASSPLQLAIVLGTAFLEQLYIIVDMDAQKIGLATPTTEMAFSDITSLEGIDSFAAHPPMTQTYDVNHMMYTVASLTALATSVPTSASASASASVSISSGLAPSLLPSASWTHSLVALLLLLV